MSVGAFGLVVAILLGLLIGWFLRRKSDGEGE